MELDSLNSSSLVLDLLIISFMVLMNIYSLKTNEQIQFADMDHVVKQVNLELTLLCILICLADEFYS